MNRIPIRSPPVSPFGSPPSPAATARAPATSSTSSPAARPGDPTIRLAAVQWGAPVGDLQAGIAPEIDAGEVAWYDPDARPLAGLYLRNLSWKHDLIIPHPAQLTGYSSFDDATFKGVRHPASPTSPATT